MQTIQIISLIIAIILGIIGLWKGIDLLVLFFNSIKDGFLSDSEERQLILSAIITISVSGIAALIGYFAVRIS